MCCREAEAMTTKKEAMAFVALLKACGKKKDLHTGMAIHAQASQKGLVGDNIFVGSALVSMYAKCGDLVRAHEALDELLVRDVVSWNALISGHVQQQSRCCEDALKCLEHIRRDGLVPDAITFTSVLKACGSAKALSKGKRIHAEMVSRRSLAAVNDDGILATALLDMYAKCGNLDKAQKVFDELGARCVVSWSALIAGYAQQGQYKTALDCFRHMQSDGHSPNVITLTSALKACGGLRDAERGRAIHDEIVRMRLLDKDSLLSTAVVDMYVKCGEFGKAQEVFDGLPLQTAASWNALIGGYVHRGRGEDAMNCFEQMQNHGLSPSEITFACILRACGNEEAIDKGLQIHNQIKEEGWMGKAHLEMLHNALICMYSKCGRLGRAREVVERFRVQNIVSWNALIAGYAREGLGEDVLCCFKRMEEEGIPPDAITLALIVNASCGATGEAELFHRDHEIACNQLQGKHIVLDNVLVNMFARRGELGRAQRVFDELRYQDVVSWNTLMTGYARDGQAEAALDCFRKMPFHNVSRDAISFAVALKACASIGAIREGKRIHDETSGDGFVGRDVIVGASLVDMYAKCGMLEKAKQTLEDGKIVPSVGSWNALISGYADHGQNQEALDCFKRMQIDGFQPDEVTYVCVLTACSRSCLVEEGAMHFENMSKVHGLAPKNEHHTCVVDLYARVGLFEKAIATAKKMPSPDYYPAWCALLSSCRKWGNAELGRLAFEGGVVDRISVPPRDIAKNYMGRMLHEGSSLMDGSL